MADAWKDSLQRLLSLKAGPKKGKGLFEKYKNAFSSSYIEEVEEEQRIINDILQMEQLSSQQPINLYFYRFEDNLHLRIFQYQEPIPLYETLPLLENMGLRVINERPYRIKISNAKIWISDTQVTYSQSNLFEVEKVKDIFQETFLNTQLGLAENDGFNKLTLATMLSCREITILRAYAKYLKQIGFRFSQAYIELALVNNPQITIELIRFFKLKHDPKQKNKNPLVAHEQTIIQLLENVSSLDEDRIISQLFAVMKATLRTNYFQLDRTNQPKNYLSLKLKSTEIPDLPLPYPEFEIFVYAPRFEGIHLRCAKVARGGIRWSDRREDFRVEILGLMKAQKVKNAVIVPSGAKGGFVLKTLPANANREVIQKEVVTCYQEFIRGLLDITDNIKKGKIIRPNNVVCYDDDDPYLVVAADKGTATFSDIANSISKEYQFWLGDAFASGGSTGYDHKKMGITARGAWESVKRHFYELNIDIHSNDFTAVGIGDMSGDVFGNGLIYTPHCLLIAAFDHRHIFLDPTPNPDLTYKERIRLFNLPHSSWEDFNSKFISQGGGVFKRSLKSIPLSTEIRRALDIKETALPPNELIRAILKAPVDLLWNGGIGTYVKASTENHADVGDKTNEYCRINGNELRCKIVGEGGNLGFTQLGRIEFASQGGFINTDFIDNSAGVDCSDHEVNIKILLNAKMVENKLTEKKRNTLLTNMTQEVAELVLKDNYQQAAIMSYAHYNASKTISMYQEYIKDLEAAGHLNRQVEFLPDDKKLLERKTAGLGLTRPELAVLLAYTKIYLQNEILKSDLPENPFLTQSIYTAFPPTLRKNFSKDIEHHSLRRELIATQLSNQIVNETGIIFIYNLQIETGATVPEIIFCHTIASQIYQAPELQRIVRSLDFKIPLTTQYELLNYIRRLVNLATRWFLQRHYVFDENKTADLIQQFSQGIKKLENIIPNLMGGSTKLYLETLTEQFERAGISADIAYRIATVRGMYTALNIIEVATRHRYDLIKTAKVYFAVGEHFNLLWFRDRLVSDTREGYWDTLTRFTLRDELDILQKMITVNLIENNKKENNTVRLIDAWKKQHPRAIERWAKLMEMVSSSSKIDYVMFFIALRELANLIHTTETV